MWAGELYDKIKQKKSMIYNLSHYLLLTMFFVFDKSLVAELLTLSSRTKGDMLRQALKHLKAEGEI